MGKKAYPVTPAIRTLREEKVPFSVHLYQYQDKGGARQAAAAFSLEERAVIKTLVFQDENKRGFLVLMHGNLQVSVKQLARQLECKKAVPCDHQQAMKLTGYKVGGISPFGTRTPLPIYIESSIFDLETIYINGGKRGLLVQIDPTCLKTVFEATPVGVALPL
ncbi:MAG: aminoacyl-tRNA deacylase [Desulfobacterales bacterium]|nr:aminoacyl-tRNA deacylase [Desulfobacterales bacterium]